MKESTRQVLSTLRASFPRFPKNEGEKGTSILYSKSDKAPGCAIGIFLLPEDANALDEIGIDLESAFVPVELQCLYTGSAEARSIFEKYPIIMENHDLFVHAQHTHDDFVSEDFYDPSEDSENGFYSSSVGERWKSQWEDFFDLYDPQGETRLNNE